MDFSDFAFAMAKAAGTLILTDAADREASGVPGGSGLFLSSREPDGGNLIGMMSVTFDENRNADFWLSGESATLLRDKLNEILGE